MFTLVKDKSFSHKVLDAALQAAGSIYTFWKFPPPSSRSGGYQPMTFRGKISKRRREKGQYA